MAPEHPAGNDQNAENRVPAGLREIDNAWIGEHYPRIYRAAWIMTGDPWEAEDLAQEAFVVAIDRWDKFERRSSDSTWLYGILIRLSQRRGRTLARMRRRLIQYVERNGLTPGGEDQSQDPQVVMASEQWRQSIWADVARLPSTQRIAVTLRYAEEMTYEQIAEMVGCATGTAKTRVHHGLKRLRQKFGDAAPDDLSRVDQPDRHPTTSVPTNSAASSMKPPVQIAHKSVP